MFCEVSIQVHIQKWILPAHNLLCVTVLKKYTELKQDKLYFISTVSQGYNKLLNCLWLLAIEKLWQHKYLLGTGIQLW